MEDLILSRIDYGMLAFFVVALIFVVVLVVGTPSPSQQKEEASRAVVKAEQSVVRHLPEYAFLAVLLGFFIVLTIATQHTSRQWKYTRVIESDASQMK